MSLVMPSALPHFDVGNVVVAFTAAARVVEERTLSTLRFGALVALVALDGLSWVEHHGKTMEKPMGKSCVFFFFFLGGNIYQ